MARYEQRVQQWCPCCGHYIAAYARFMGGAYKKHINRCAPATREDRHIFVTTGKWPKKKIVVEAETV